MTGRAITPEQKRAVVERVLVSWERRPDLRLGQLLVTAHNASVSTGAVAMFYAEDEALALAAEAFAGGRSPPDLTDEFTSQTVDRLTTNLAVQAQATSVTLARAHAVLRRAQDAEAEVARLKRREADIVEACERVADGGQCRADVVSAIQTIRRQRDERGEVLRKIVADHDERVRAVFTSAADPLIEKARGILK